jgi:uncharacterized protein YqcC (DUF446 family)
MKRIGYWQPEPLESEQYNFERAFAMDTMAFPQWNKRRRVSTAKHGGRTGRA